MLDIHDGCDPYGPSLVAGPWTFPLNLLLGLWVMALSLALGALFFFMALLIIFPTNFLLNKFLPSIIRPENDLGASIGIRQGFAFFLCLIVIDVQLCVTDLKSTLVQSLINWAFLVAMVLPGFILNMFLEKYAESFPRVSRSVFITWEDETKRRAVARGPKENPTALCFGMFLYTTVWCIAWYSYRYNPEGTVDRGWTGVFG
ncbi:uncharacterized protein K444DRAFT_53212 [Hyaloscypha bicolor E]|uniref:Uncharacterized protein n=1 Tax=Hyaloscypha bicolor E TaxID=1095630 RepID=A0A2J6T3A5_9HELO|nr:uncharacterized protein K444DRAFT_53212 [Hyaloscypha bicolor E]PMD57393.1 hypothetical protein K444DRAFT_53212 [Hyaloscypha bicolor E]